MYEMVASDSQSVAVSADLPDGEFGVGHLGASCDGGGTAVNGLHGVGVDIIRQSAATSDAGNHRHVVGRHAHLCHGLVQ